MHLSTFKWTLFFLYEVIAREVVKRKPVAGYDLERTLSRFIPSYSHLHLY